MGMNADIDIVIPWVDGNDTQWRKLKKQYELQRPFSDEEDSNIRYESWDLKYWFRAVEKFMPWVHKIFFVTWGHLPDFLNVSNPKLRIVKHDEYIPSDYLPTFNSNTIEMNFFRISDLSENFILFNDDTIPLRAIDESYYFRGNIPCDEAVEAHIFVDQNRWYAYLHVNLIMMINKHFRKREVQEKFHDKWFSPEYGDLLERTKSLSYWYDFCGIRDPHLPVAYRKNTFEEIWTIEHDELDKASRNRFRDYSDYSHYLARYWRLCEGEFIPRRTEGKAFVFDINNYDEVVNSIKTQKYPVICMNENCTSEEFIKIKQEISKAFQLILPEKSSFEK